MFPDLDEANFQADHIEQAYRRATEVLKLTLECQMEDKKLIPEPTPRNLIGFQEGQRIIIVSCIPKAKIKYDKKHFVKN
jgi:predicted RNase H-like HicB family nuclease